MEKINLILNGKPVLADKGSTVLETAQLHGVEIPTLCHDQRLKPTAACRICLVRVEGARNPLPACATTVSDGMVISTHTEELVKTRQTALELMLSDHYGDCIAPCKLACPASIDIQGYIGLIANGMYTDALSLIMESNPLPSICGRVCPRFCEKQCRRNIVDSPVAINALKRFATDYATRHDFEVKIDIKPATGHKVAIIGGGPAGLTAAHYLAKQGHAVALFDSNPQLGGMMRYGIPAYRLPRDVLDKEIERITRMCLQVKCNVTLGKDFDLESLRKDGFEAIFIAIGAQADQKMRIPGEDLPGVLSGIGFLREIALGRKIKVGRKVAVIGGGNTAIDAAQSAVRLGAEEVTIVYRRTREEMPASADEIKQAEDKGVKFQFLTAPTKIQANNSHGIAMECIRMNLGELDSSGRRKPIPAVGSEFILDMDNVIMAVGQSLSAPAGDSISSLKLDRSGYISINKETMQTTLDYVFAGGDCASGPATVVQAIGAGKRAAASIDSYILNGNVVPQTSAYNCSKGDWDKIDASEYADIQQIPRGEMPTLDPKQDTGFDEYELGFTENMASIESERCLACGCEKVFNCTLRDLANEYKVSSDKYNGYKHRYPVNKVEHPNILRDANKCILCGRCVRICSEIVGLGVLGFVNRGFETTVEPAFGVSLSETNCTSCGLCISTCPTGAILPRIALHKPGPWELQTTPSICPGCGIGCGIVLNRVDNSIIKVTANTNSDVNSGNLCEKGMFGAILTNSQQRFDKPLLLKDGKLVETSWPEAISAAAGGLNTIKQSGDVESALVVSANLTNEELYLAQKLARTTLGTNTILSPLLPPLNEGFLQYLGKDGSTCTFSDLRESDLIVMLDCALEDKYPVAAMMIRKAATQGSRLVTASSRQGPLDLMAGTSLKVNKRTSVDVLNAMLTYLLTYNLIDSESMNSIGVDIRDSIEEIKHQPLTRLYDIPWINPSRVVAAAQLYIRAKRPVIVVDGDTVTPAEAAAISRLAIITGNSRRKDSGILILRSQCNAQGALDMGISPAHLPGQIPITSDRKKVFETEWGCSLPALPGLQKGATINQVNRHVGALLLIGENATYEATELNLTKPLFSVWINSVLPAKPPYPSVILPCASFAESEGTITNCEGRIQKVNPAIEPPAGKKTWQILAELSSVMGCRMDYASVSSINEEIMKVTASVNSEYAAT